MSYEEKEPKIKELQAFMGDNPCTEDLKLWISKEGLRFSGRTETFSNTRCSRHYILNSKYQSNPTISVDSKERLKMKANHNIHALVLLADKGLSKELKETSIHQALPAAIREALERKIEEKNLKAADDAAETILTFEREREYAVESRVRRIRKLRREIDRLKKEANEINAAAEHGRKTLNYLPLAQSLGYAVTQYLLDYSPVQVAAFLKVSNTEKTKTAQD
jgi:uncharacterized secreted protein with C-terminal beta-propeller domain